MIIGVVVVVIGFMSWVFKTAPRNPSPRRWNEKKCSARENELELKSKPLKTGLKYAVVGVGQVGRRILEALCFRGERDTIAFDAFDNDWLRSSGLDFTFVKGDIRDLEALKAALQDVDVVYCTASVIRYYERMDFQASFSESINVQGMKNVVEACVFNGVKILIQTSSSNVNVYDGAKNLIISEDSPYVTRKTSPNHYGWSKAEQEQIVLKSNGRKSKNGVLRTGSVRPCSGIFGPRDGFILQKYMNDSKIDFFFPEPVIDWIYVDNVVWCHLLLEKQLLEETRSGKDVWSGHVFCASNEDPLSIENLHLMLREVHPIPIQINYLPRNLLLGLSHIVEWIQWFSSGNALAKSDLRLLTPAMTRLARIGYVLKSTKARDALGYRPLFTVDDAVKWTSKIWMREQGPSSKKTK
mgnify:CR=1 FL=1